MTYQTLPRESRKLAAIAIALLWPCVAVGEPVLDESVSRSVTVVNRAVPPPTYGETVSRAATVVNRGVSDPTFSEANSRAVSTLRMVPNGGRIVLSNDEWTLSDTGFARQPQSTAQFARNVAGWFADGQPAHFLAYSASYGVTGSQLQSTMNTAGHVWIVDTAAPHNVQSLLEYQGVFVGGYSIENEVLIDYVRAGGNVYVFGGAGGSWNPPHDAPQEASEWAAFLDEFGLGLDESYDGFSGDVGINSDHPIFAGVTSLYQGIGQDVVDRDTGNPANEVLVVRAGHTMFAVYDPGREPCPGDLDGDRGVSLGDLSALLAHFGTPSGATYADGDLDANGNVDLSDLALLLANFGTTCP